MTITTVTTREFNWADEKGDPRVPGIRIDRARGWVFLPDADALQVATDIVEILTAKKERAQA